MTRKRSLWTVAVLAAMTIGVSGVLAQVGPLLDTTPPEIVAAVASPGILWPANHKMREITLDVLLVDDMDPDPVWTILDVTSNEPVTGPGDETDPDWNIRADNTLQLRAERLGTGNGRVYTITIEASDADGNAVTETIEVTVPHDKGQKKGLNRAWKLEKQEAKAAEKAARQAEKEARRAAKQAEKEARRAAKHGGDA